MLLKRYGNNIEYIMHLPLKRGIKFLEKALTEETKEYAFRIYLVSYPYMDKDNFKTFNEFWEEIKPANIQIDKRNTEDLMSEVLQIEKSFEKGGK